MKYLISLFSVFFIFLLSSCSDADVASRNLSRDADYFNINRRIVFYNGITGDFMLSIEGYCSRGNNDAPGEVSITCKTGPNSYKKHYLGLSDNVTYFIEQIEPVAENVRNYKVIFKPSVIVPDISVKCYCSGHFCKVNLIFMEVMKWEHGY